MKNYELAGLLHQTVNELVETDIGLAEDLYRLVEGITKIQRETEFPARHCMNFGEFSEKARIDVLMFVLIQIATIYEGSVSAKQTSYVNDLLDKIAVGYFNESEIESSYAEELKTRDYKISARDAEFALQVRISNLLEEAMPNGSWIVE